MEMKLSQRFALIALNGQDSINYPTAKRAAMRCIAAACIMDIFLAGAFEKAGEDFKLSADFKPTTLELYQEFIYNYVIKRQKTMLSQMIKCAAGYNRFVMKKFEHILRENIVVNDIAVEIPNLLGCDINYNINDMSIREYRSNRRLYDTEIEVMRAEIMEPESLSDDTILLLWLLRESSTLQELFTKAEQEQIKLKMNEQFIKGNEIAKIIYPLTIYNGYEKFASGFIKWKKEMMKNQYLVGLGFVFPILNREQNIFIDLDKWFSNAEDRYNALVNRLEKHGHEFEVIHYGEVPIIRIDNVIYEALPTQISSKVPIQGVRLRRYLM